MKIRYFLSFVFLLCSLTAFTQFNNHRTSWYPGIVILDTDEIIKGELSYDYANDLVMCRSDEKIKTFGAHQAVSFQFYNEKENVFHKFKVFNVQHNSYYTQKGFFEIVLDGDVNYIRKRNRYPIYQQKDGYLVERTINPHELAFDYFVEVNGKLTKARKFKKEVLPQLLLNEQSLEAYMKEQRLKTYDIADQIVLLSYYNRLADKPGTAAKTNLSKQGEKSGSD